MLQFKAEHDSLIDTITHRYLTRRFCYTPKTRGRRKVFPTYVILAFMRLFFCFMHFSFVNNALTPVFAVTFFLAWKKTQNV